MLTGERWRLGRRPALDGLRGVAILLVLLTHTRTPGFETAGAVGVTVFFTLSGFLITSLLLEEREASGRVGLVAFYLRRARRLFPALVVVVMVVAALSLLVPGVVPIPILVGSVTYSANWVLAGGGYEFGGGALGHTWSLAIEEQFYLAWPLLLIACRWVPRRVMLCLIGAACAGALAWRMLLAADGASVFRLYYGSDVRADNLLIGCGLAFLLHRSRVRSVLPGVAAVGLAAVVLLTFVSGEAVFVWVPTVVCLTTAAVIYVAVSGAEVRWLAWEPLALLGRRSYGLYLWHLPVGVLVTMMLGGSPVVAWLVTVPLSWGLTLLSWRFVEERFSSSRSAGTRPARTTVAARSAEPTRYRARHLAGTAGTVAPAPVSD